MVVGIGVNTALWLCAPGISWLWWNVTGFIATLMAGAALGEVRQARGLARPAAAQLSALQVLATESRWNWPRWSLLLLAWFAALFGLLWWLQR